MRIGLDLRPFLREETGIGVYFRNLLFSLAKIDRENEYFLFSSSLKDRFSVNKIPAFTRMNFRDFHYPVEAINFFWYRLLFPPLDYFFKKRLDLTHSPTPLILPTKGKKIISVHDLFFVDSPELTDKDTRKNFPKRVYSSIQKADGVIAVSEFVKEQLLNRFVIDEEKVKVIYHGTDPDFYSEVPARRLDRVIKKHTLPSDFLLFVGAIEPRKNLTNLIKALKIVHKRHKKISLVIAGRKGSDYSKVKALILKNRLEDWVKTLDYLPSEEVRCLYNLASLFVFPSLCEGFGLPLLEAMASRLPLVVSGVSALPEIADDAALYFDPNSPESIAGRVIEVLQDKSLQKKLIVRGRERSKAFDWEKTAVETLDFYKTIAGGAE